MSSAPFQQCLDEFHTMNQKLDRLDVAIRGNGKPGILVRLDRLERVSQVKNRVLWLLIGAVIMGVGSKLFG